MDTKDLKNLLQNQSSDTSLTPQGVWHYTRRRKRARQRIATVTAVAALTVGIGLGAVYLGSSARNQRPEILTVPSTPEPSPTTTPTTTEQASTEPTSAKPSTTASSEEEHPDETPPKPGAEPKCVLPMPQSWLNAFEAETAVSSDETVAFVERGTRVKLVQGKKDTGTLSLVSTGGKETLIDDQVDTVQFHPVTDGRFVVYPDTNGRVMVWDRTSGAESQPIDFLPADGAGRSLSISNGRLWISSGEVTPNSGDPVFTEASLHVVDLNAGLKAELVLENQKFQPLTALDGRGQVHLVDGGTRFVDPDGTMEPVVKGYPQYGAEGRTGQILALSDGSEASGVWLHHSGWGEPVQMVEEGAGSYGGVAGEWLASDNRLHNLFTDAAFEDRDAKHSYTFTVPARGEVLISQHTASEKLSDDIMVRTIPLSDLPEEDVTCR
ncbi:MAG: hypothetical protein Q4D89_13375 [Arachnia propionica]|uniref:hypothetical protein n=1 Tax=Arachnia propionica TaxID=1750 RepID=UPI00270677F8|nr:hypothetical protein [Arachnia propionica]